MRRLIDAGTLGTIDFIRATCQGNLLEQGTHVIDMLLFYNDYRPVEWVMGQVGDLDGPARPQASAPDAAVATMAFANGVRALFECGTIGRRIPGETNKWYHFGVDVYGDRGHAMVSLNQTLRVTTYDDGQTVTESSSWDNEYVAALAAHLDAVAAYVRHPDRGHISDLERSMLSFNTIMAIYASSCYGGKITLPRQFEDSLIEDLQHLASRKSAT